MNMLTEEYLMQYILNVGRRDSQSKTLDSFETAELEFRVSPYTSFRTSSKLKEPDEQ